VLLSLTLEEIQTLSRAYLSFPGRVSFPGRSGYLNSRTHQSSYQIVRRASRSTHAPHSVPYAFNEKLLTQIKKLKTDKKSLKNKLEELITKVSKSSDVTIQVDEKILNTDSVNITTQEEDKLVEVKMYSEVEV